jgi:hypothetical protein
MNSTYLDVSPRLCRKIQLKEMRIDILVRNLVYDLHSNMSLKKFIHISENDLGSHCKGTPMKHAHGGLWDIRKSNTHTHTHTHTKLTRCCIVKSLMVSNTARSLGVTARETHTMQRYVFLFVSSPSFSLVISLLKKKKSQKIMRCRNHKQYLETICKSRICISSVDLLTVCCISAIYASHWQ